MCLPSVVRILEECNELWLENLKLRFQWKAYNMYVET